MTARDPGRLVNTPSRVRSFVEACSPWAVVFAGRGGPEVVCAAGVVGDLPRRRSKVLTHH